MVPSSTWVFTSGDKRKDGSFRQKDEIKHGKDARGQGSYDRPKPSQPIKVFTFLNTTYKSILMNENHMILMPSNYKLPWQVDKDTRVFCQYYQYNGHDTESCFALRNIVERLISEGKLDQYLGERPTTQQKPN